MKSGYASLFVIALALAGAQAAHAKGSSAVKSNLDIVRNSVIAQGTVAYETYTHDADTGQDWTYQRSIEVTNLVVDAPNCKLSFHYHVITNGEATADLDSWVPVNNATSISVATEAVLVGRRDAQAGHASWSSHPQPEIYDAVVNQNGTENVFSFYSLAAAQRVAAAFMNAAHACGANPVKDY